MSEVMKKYEDEAIFKSNVGKVQKMIIAGCTKEFILQIGFTEKEYSEAQGGLCCTVSYD